MTPGLTFSQKTVLREVNIRGRVMTFATEIELLLIKVILFSIYNPDEDILRSFVRMTMGKKIETAIKDLQKYKPEVYVEYSHLFDSLSKLVEFRNHMAHCQMAWNEDNPSYITVIDFEKIQGVRNACKVMPVTYTLMEIEGNIDALRLLILDFAKLHVIMEADINQKYPSLFNSSIS